MKIALCQLDYHVGNFELNTAKIINAIKEAKKKGADLAVFAELAVCGYPPRDFLEFHHFVALCEQSVEEIASHCHDIAAIVGAPSINPVHEGKDLFNSAYFLEYGRVRQIIHKTLLPNYDVFDEYRYFEPNTIFSCIEFMGCKIALTICEDLWNIDDNPLYRLEPMRKLKAERPDIAINIAASPFSFTHDEKRTEILTKNAKKYGVPFFYVNHVGAQTELIFDGGSTITLPSGDIYKMKFFEELIEVFDVDAVKAGEGAAPNIYHNKTKLIYEALRMGVQDYFRKQNFQKAVLGLSGGIDSAVVYAIAVKALGSENVLPVLLPSAFTSKPSVDDALEMVKTLKTPHQIISIVEAQNAFLDTLSYAFNGLPQNITEENLQARVRGTILMALANKLGLILLNTSNKSELAVGYSTLYGDSIGGLSVIGDVYKTEVYALANYLNQEFGNIIPENIITRAPTAELRPDQKDTDSLPPYETLDPILFQYIENRKGPQEIVNMGYEKELVDKILKLVNQSEWKRFQAPPILRVSDKAFGMGRRLPIVAKYLA